MDDEMKQKILRGERLLEQEQQLRKMTPEEIRAELEARLESALDDYVADSLRSRRLTETSSLARKREIR